MTTEKNKKISIRHQSATWFLVFLMAGSFLFGENVLAVGDYNKVDGSRLNPDEWNNLVSDFVTTWATSTMAGPLGIGTAPSAALDIFGKLKFTSGGTIYNTDSTRYLDMTGILSDSLRVSGNIYSTGGSLKADGTGINYMMGSLGIGTTAPQAGMKMDIRSANTDGSSAITAYGYNGNGGVAIKGYGYAVGGEGLNYGVYGRSGGSRASGVNIGGYFEASGAANNYALITGSGNVGIGTTNPGYKLEVNGNISIGSDTGLANPRLVFNTTTYRWFTQGLNGNYQISQDGGAGDVLTILRNTGNVGIGTTNPTTAKLVINPSGTYSIDAGNGRIGNLGTPALDTDAATVGYVKSVAAGTSTVPTVGYWTANGTNIYSANAGNVGIGTTNPGAKLNVLGDLYVDADWSNDTAIRIREGGGNNYGAFFKYGAGDLLAIGTRNGTTTDTVAMQIDRGSQNVIFNGNVGISTTTPAYTLGVAGTGQFTQPVIVGTPTATNHAATKSYVDSAAASAAGASWTVSGNNIYNSNSGNVGVGTTNPSYKLSVSGTGYFSDTLSVYNATAGKDLLYLNGADGDKWIGVGGHELHIGTSGYAHNGLYLGPKGSTSGTLNSNVYINWADATPTRYNRWMLSAGPSNGSISGYANDGVTVNTYINTVGNSYFNYGNVGIGSTVPAYKLDVTGTGSFTQPVIVGTPTAANHAITKSYFDSAIGDPVGAGTAGQTLRNDGNGWVANSTLFNNGTNVGIGTTAPVSQLHLNNNGDISSGFVKGIRLQSNARSYQISSGVQGVSNAYFGIADVASSTYRLVINDSGNVGIGKTNPTAKFDVLGNVKIGSNSQGVWLDSTGSSGNTNYGSQIYLTNDLGSSQGAVMLGSAYNNFGTIGAANFVIGRSVTTQTYGANPAGLTYTPSLVIEGFSGNVGIGSTVPAYKLDVAGTGSFTQPVIVGTPTAANHAITKSYFDSAIGDPVGAGTAGQTLRNDGNGWVANSTLFNNGTNVGIGTTTPAGKLHIAGSWASTILTGDNIIVRKPDFPSGGGWARNLLNFQENDGTSYFQIGALGNNNSFSNGYLGVAYDDTTMRWYSNKNVAFDGNVGIGSTAPAYKLDVAGTGSFTQPVIVGTPTATNHAATKSYVDSAAASAAGASWTVSGNNIYNSNSGNVGIGTTVPNSKLDVQGTGASVSIGNTAALGADVGSSLLFKSNWATGHPINAAAGIFGAKETAVSGSANGYLSFSTYGPLPTNNLNERMRINSAGNVGIGTTNPFLKLDVRGAVAVVSGLNNNSVRPAVGNTRINGEIAGVNSGSLGGDDGFLRLSAGGGTNATQKSFIDLSGYSNVGDMINNIAFGTNGVETMRIVSSKIGIGTTTPAYKLDVAGTGEFTQPVIVGTPTAANHAITKSYFDSAIGDPVGAGTAGQTLRNDGNGWVANSTLFNNGTNVGIGTTNPGAKLSVLSNITATTTGEQMGSTISTYFINADTGLKQGLRLNTSSGNTSGSINSLIGVLSLMLNNGNEGTTDNASSYWSRVDVGTGHTVTNGYNFLVNQASISGTMVNQYGLYVNQLSGATNNFAVYTAGTTPSYFGGNVGIGSTAPSAALDVFGKVKTTSGGTIYNTDSSRWLDMTGTLTDSLKVSGDLYSTAGELKTDGAGINYMMGNLGIGTTTPSAKLEVVGGAKFNVGTGMIAILNPGVGYTGIYSDSIYNSAGFNLTYWNGSSVVSGIKLVGPSGSVGIGTTNPSEAKLVINAGTGEALKAYGNGIFTGTLQTQTGSDFAEEFITSGDLEPGTVVVMDDNGHKSVKPCAKSYDKTVVGIVSNNPSIIAGRVNSKHKAIIAMMGVVKVKVSNINGNISKGDLLTTSGIYGYAMKALDTKPGTVIGKALENLNKSTGEINVLVNLQ